MTLLPRCGVEPSGARVLTGLALVVATTAPVGAQEPVVETLAPPAVSMVAPRPLRLADYYEFVQPGSLMASPDGSRVVFTRTDVEADQDRTTTSIWSVGIDGSDLHRLASGGDSPRFAPDGSSLAFLREGQVWILPFAGGEPWQLTGLAGRVRDFAWSPDGRRVVVVAREGRDAAPPVLPEDQRAEPLPAAAASALAEPTRPDLPPLDAGEWIPVVEPEPAEAIAAAAEVPVVAAAEEGEGTPEPVAVSYDPAGYPPGAVVDPLPPGEEPLRPLPAVITRLQFKADGTGYVGSRPQHLFVVEVPGMPGLGAARRLTGGRFSDGAPQWSPDGRWVAFSSNRTPEPDTNDNTDVWLVAADGGDVLQVTTDPGQDGSPRWSPDGRYLVYRHVPLAPAIYANDRLRLVPVGIVSGGDRGPADAGGAAGPALQVGPPVELTAGLDRPLGSAPVWSADRTAVFVTLQDRGTVSLIRVSTGLSRFPAGRRRRRRPAPNLPAGASAAVLAGPRVVDDFVVLPGGREVVAVLSAGTQPPEVYRVAMEPRRGAVPMDEPTAHVRPTPVPPAAQLHALTALNAGWRARVELAEPEPLRFHSGDEALIEGWLLRPPGYREGIRYPLIVRIHGGPVSQFTWGFSWERQWLAAQGYAVLFVNPRGSSGYGEQFALDLWANWGGPDLEDVLAGVDHLVGRGIVNPDRVGVGGWSYGGILTNYLITRTERFAAAVSGASEADYFACYGTDDLQRWWEDELGLPYEPEARPLYRSLSPIYDVGRITTPTLFMVGEEDARVPASQSEQIYTQLRRRMVDGGPQTGLIVYPGESHGISRPSFLIDRWLRYRAWFDLYLKNDASADPFFGRRAW